MSVHVIKDEPARKIEMLESIVPVMVSGIRYNRYEYHARLNEGEWLDLGPFGNRIPDSRHYPVRTCEQKESDF